MITELYELDQELTENSMGNDVTFEIMEKSGSSWTTSFTLSSSQIVAESMELDQSICDTDEIVIGGCIPSQLKLNVMNVADLTGKRIAVKIRGRYRSELLYPSTTLYPSSTLYPGYSLEQTDQYVLFIGDIISCKRSENKRYRKLIAFDRMYYASTVKCKEELYNFIKDNYWEPPSQSASPQEMHLNNLIHHLCIKGKINPTSLNSDFINYTEAFDMSPYNFAKVVDKDFTPLQGLKWICELNGAFWIEDMPTSLSSDKATPRNVLPFVDWDDWKTISTYSSLKYEDYSVKGIGKATFLCYSDNGFERDGSATIEKSPPQGYDGFDSIYNSDNGLTKSMQSALNNGSARSIYTVVHNLQQHGDVPDRILGFIYQYRPFKASIFNRWWVQVGDRVHLPTNDTEVPFVRSIVMSRKIKGINSMKVTIEAKGLEVQGKENSI